MQAQEHSFQIIGSSAKIVDIEQKELRIVSNKWKYNIRKR